MDARHRLHRTGITLALLLALAPAAPAEVRHRVQAGDTVPRLSWQYKIRADRIRAANGLRSDVLSPGQVLVIPDPEGTAATAPPTRPDSPRGAEPPRPAARGPQPTPPPQEVRTAVSVDRRTLPGSERPESAPVRAARVEPGPLPPPVPGPLPGPRDEPPLDVARAPRTAKLGPGLSRDLPRVPEERAEPARPGRGQPQDEPALETPTVQPPPSRAEPRQPEPRESAGTPGQALIQAAQRLSREGVPYNGSWTPPGERSAWVMDCSNTARWLYRSALGLELPRTASDQYLALQRAGKLHKAPRGWFSSSVNRGRLDRDLRTGDLLFWENTYRPVRRPDITHVMVFLGTDTQGRWMMAGSERAKGVNIYTFDPDKKKGGYSTFLGLFKHHGKFVAYGRGI